MSTEAKEIGESKPKFELVRVTWHDHYNNAGWHDTEDFHDPDPGVLIESVGYLIGECEDSIRLAASVCVDNGTCTNVAVILKRTVESRVYLEVSEVTQGKYGITGK